MISGGLPRQGKERSQRRASSHSIKVVRLPAFLAVSSELRIASKIVVRPTPVLSASSSGVSAIRGMLPSGLASWSRPWQRALSVANKSRNRILHVCDLIRGTYRVSTSWRCCVPPDRLNDGWRSAFRLRRLLSDHGARISTPCPGNGFSKHLSQCRRDWYSVGNVASSAQFILEAGPQSPCKVRCHHNRAG